MTMTPSARSGLLSRFRDAIGPLNAEQALELEARIGVNSGEAVATVEQSEQRPGHR